jgi:DNA-binding transcriptional LysR family regulator
MCLIPASIAIARLSKLLCTSTGANFSARSHEAQLHHAVAIEQRRVYAWELRHDGRDMEVWVCGQLTFNGAYQMVGEALSGCGLTFVPEDLAGPHVHEGRLISVMEDWCTSFPGLHAYYPSRCHSSRALALGIDAIRYKA